LSGRGRDTTNGHTCLLFMYVVRFCWLCYAPKFSLPASLVSLLRKHCTCYTPTLYSTLHRQYLRLVRTDILAYCRYTGVGPWSYKTTIFATWGSGYITPKHKAFISFPWASLFSLASTVAYIFLRCVLVTDGSVIEVPGRCVKHGRTHLHPRHW
jgi:hypothetical protein